MKSRVPWMRVLGEGATIITSILLALAIEAWWSERQARAAARDQLASVLEELYQARDEIQTHGTWHERRREATVAIREQLHATPVGERVTLPEGVLALAFGMNVSDPPGSLLDTFLSSGAVDDLGNEELRRGLIGWQLKVKDLQDDELWARDFSDNEMRAYAVRALDFSRIIDVGTRMWAAQSTEFGGSDTSFESDLVLRNLMGMNESYSSLTGRQAREAVASAEELATLIESELR